MKEANIHFEPGINEDLAATALWGTQQSELRGESKYDGIFGIWYGKGPGVDRAGDALKHVNLAFELDAIIVAPATANTICKAAGGIADDIISTTLSICDVPKSFAPAMNFNMWNNKPTIDAVEILKERNITIISPEEGQLASLHKGKGRLADLNKVMNGIKKLFDYNLILENTKFSGIQI